MRERERSERMRTKIDYKEEDVYNKGKHKEENQD